MRRLSARRLTILPFDYDEDYHQTQRYAVAVQSHQLRGASFRMSSVIEIDRDLPAWQRSEADELVNAATHAIGCLLAISGAVLIAGSVFQSSDVRSIIGCFVYLASLIAVYAMSTLSHSAKSPSWKSLFRRLDQGTIFLLIAATYTPFSIAYLPSAPWWILLAAIWAMALAGFVSKVFFAHRVELVSVTPYILLGWMPALGTPTIVQTIPLTIFLWMLIGGVCYTIGTLFLIYDEHIRHFHAIWHLCVIAGSACHFFGILLVVTARPA
jgi:hemolysin III